MSDAALLLAHQGGWDEILLILTPIAIFAALLGLANRRANAELRQRAGAGSTGAGEDDPAEQGGASPASDQEDADVDHEEEEEEADSGA